MADQTKSKALILIHGRGANGDSMMPLAREFTDESFYIETPEAPGNTWYPEWFMAPPEQNEPKFSQSIATLKALIDKMGKGIGYENVYVMGFSQGAILSLELLARDPKPFGGVIAFSGGFVGEKVDKTKFKKINGTKVYLGISEKDPFIPLERAQESAKILQDLGADLTFQTYPGNTHTITPAQLKTVRELFFS